MTIGESGTTVIKQTVQITRALASSPCRFLYGLISNVSWSLQQLMGGLACCKGHAMLLTRTRINKSRSKYNACFPIVQYKSRDYNTFKNDPNFL